jgi:hypothetical protein
VGGPSPREADGLRGENVSNVGGARGAVGYMVYRPRRMMLFGKWYLRLVATFSLSYCGIAASDSFFRNGKGLGLSDVAISIGVVVLLSPLLALAICLDQPWRVRLSDRGLDLMGEMPVRIQWSAVESVRIEARILYVDVSDVWKTSYLYAKRQFARRPKSHFEISLRLLTAGDIVDLERNLQQRLQQY